jgi:hypothetical protein
MYVCMHAFARQYKTFFHNDLTMDYLLFLFFACSIHIPDHRGADVEYENRVRPEETRSDIHQPLRPGHAEQYTADIWGRTVVCTHTTKFHETSNDKLEACHVYT